MSSATLLSIAGSRLSATISSEGAELKTLVDQKAGDLLWDGDPAFWTGRAPLLFPIVGRVRDDTYTVDGGSYALPQHGFARRRVFDVVETGPSSVLLALSADASTLAVWPFAFRLAMRFDMNGDRLDMIASVRNTGDTAMPLAFGYHPAFRWPLPYGGDRADHVMDFEHPEPAAIRRPDADGLLTAPGPSPVMGDRLVLSDAVLADGALVFTDLASRCIDYGVPGRTRLRMTFADMPHLGIWTKPGAGAHYVCVEPWQGYADPQDFRGDLREKPGMLVLEPGAERSFDMSVQPID